MSIETFSDVFCSYANFAHDSKEFKVKAEQLIDASQHPGIGGRKVRICRQVRDDGVRVRNVKAVVVERGNLVQRIHLHVLGRHVLVLIEIDVLELEWGKQALNYSTTSITHTFTSKSSCFITMITA